MFVDSHCHLEMESFDKDRGSVITKSIHEGLTHILTVGTEAKYFDTVIGIVETYPSVYGAMGIHPHNSTEHDDAMEKSMGALLNHKKIVALGEIGLDFFRNYSPRDSQVAAFRAQLILAKRMSLPVIIHSRDAKKETLSLLREAGIGNNGGVIHCYSYDVAAAREFLDMGFHISIPGTITYRNAESLLFDVVKYVPANRLLSETDAPFLTPLPHRGKRNEPFFVKLTVGRMATIRNMEVNDLAASIQENFVRLFLSGHEGDEK
jgi:TatD DNase family protein